MAEYCGECGSQRYGAPRHGTGATVKAWLFGEWQACELVRNWASWRVVRDREGMLHELPAGLVRLPGWPGPWDPPKYVTVPQAWVDAVVVLAGPCRRAAMSLEALEGQVER